MSDDVRSRLGPWDHWPRSPHTYLADERPLVWVEHEGQWYEGTLIGWTWSRQGGHWWATVDYHVGRGGTHHRHSVHEDRIRKWEDPPQEQPEPQPSRDY